MATLKINKDKTGDSVNLAKAPVRRADPAKRDRTVAPSIKVAPANETASKPSQRNHRHDGKPHGYKVNQTHEVSLREGALGYSAPRAIS